MNVHDLKLDLNSIRSRSDLDLISIRSRFEFKFMTKNDNSIIIIFLG